MATNFGTALAVNGPWRKMTTWGFRVKDGLLSVICGDGNCSRRATVRLGINTLIANILVNITALRSKAKYICKVPYVTSKPDPMSLIGLPVNSSHDQLVTCDELTVWRVGRVASWLYDELTQRFWRDNWHVLVVRRVIRYIVVYIQYSLLNIDKRTTL